MRKIYTIITFAFFFGAAHAQRQQGYAGLSAFASCEEKGALLAFRAGLLAQAAQAGTFSRLWLGGEAAAYRFLQDDYSAAGMGIRPVIHVSFYENKNFSLFYEAKGGTMFMFPEYRSRASNFTFDAGAGIDVFAGKNKRLRAGVGYTHFSNGKRNGYRENGTWDGAGIFLDCVWRK